MDAVLFDFNGVLVDDEHLHFDCFNVVLAPLGITLTLREYEDIYLGFDDRGVFETALRTHKIPHHSDTVPTLIEKKSVAYAQRAATELRIFDGAAALVRAVSEHSPVLIVSGALRAEIEGALAVMNVRECVQTIVAAEDVSACKPDPEGYLAGLAWLQTRGFIQPSSCIAIEDSTAGVIAARSAGLKVLAVEHTYPRIALEQAGAHAIYRTLTDVSVAQIAALAISR
jgi:beta-phosphoglucomutase